MFLQFFVRVVSKIEKTPGFYHVSSTIFSYIEKSPIFLCFIAQNIAQTWEKQRVSIVIGPTSYRKKTLVFVVFAQKSREKFKKYIFFWPFCVQNLAGLIAEGVWQAALKVGHLT